MRNVIICDDEAAVREQLISYLGQAEPVLKERFHITQCASGEELLEVADQADIILLDIQMGDLSGMDAAHILREKNKDVCLIFITSMMEYALEGYLVHAFGFLRKPVNYGTLLQQMEDAIHSLNAKQGKIISLKRDTQVHSYNCHDIYCFEVQSHSVLLSLEKEEVEYYTNLNDIEEMVQGQGFFRCHKSYLVNLRFIHKILPDDLLLQNGKTIPLSRHRKKEFLEEYAAYVEGR